MFETLNEWIKSCSVMRWTLKRRRIALIAIFICICFLIYQLLSLKELSVQMSDQISQTRHHNDFAKQTDESGGQEMKQIEPNLIQTMSGLNNKSGKQVIVYGVLPKFIKLYQSTGDPFRCLLSGELIPRDQINDDYCDCLDGSDEPSTNACPNNRSVFCLN